METYKHASKPHETTSPLPGNPPRRQAWNPVVITQAVVARLLLLGEILFVGAVALTTTSFPAIKWYQGMPAVVFFVAEGVTRITKFKGYEGKWFSPCFLLYLLAGVPSCWVLELDRLESFENLNTTAASAVNIDGAEVPVRLTPNFWALTSEQTLIFMPILCRWILPRGKMTRDQLSELLFLFIGIASDIMEIFYLFDEKHVRGDKILTYIILVVWSISLVQFSLVLTMRKKKIADEDGKPGQEVGFLCAAFTTEVWSLFVIFVLQDGPFIAVRLYALIYYHIFTYTIIFFTCKNALVIGIFIYRLTIFCVRRCKARKKDKGGESKGDNSKGEKKAEAEKEKAKEEPVFSPRSTKVSPANGKAGALKAGAPKAFKRTGAKKTTMVEDIQA